MLNNAEYDTCKLCKYDPHSLAASIKRFLMQMPNNLLSHVPVDLLEAAAENPRLALKFGHHIPGTDTHTHTLSSVSYLLCRSFTTSQRLSLSVDRSISLSHALCFPRHTGECASCLGACRSNSAALHSALLALLLVSLCVLALSFPPPRCTLSLALDLYQDLYRWFLDLCVDVMNVPKNLMDSKAIGWYLLLFAELVSLLFP
jgi:hypothetical protein